MSPELEEFRQRIVKLSTVLVSRAPKIENEAMTNVSLVQPFLAAIGYDVGNPDEVSPEHHADFSDKYQNKVDYAILNRGNPVIAIESKRVGAAIKDDRGQLKSYFNACPTVKLGVLTDGLRYELYADSDKPNMMDDSAYLRFNFSDIAKSGTLDDNTLDGLSAIRNGFFNPEDVGAEAKRKLLFESLIDTIKQFKSDPSDDFIRFVLSRSAIGGKITKLTQGIVDANRDVIRSAMEAFVAQEALARFGYDRKDLIPKVPSVEQPTVSAAVVVPEPVTDVLAPTKGELNAFSYAKDRLFFLVHSDALFQEIQKLKFRKLKTSFRVYYGRPNNGSLFDYKEQRDGRRMLQFPALSGKEIAFVQSAELDECLLKACTLRFTELGISSDAPPVLRAIKGGQSSCES